jgi:hypothetical protein
VSKCTPRKVVREKLLAGAAAKRQIAGVSKAEIIRQLPKLSKRERREIVRCIFEIEDDHGILSDSDRRADERFSMLDDAEVS